MKNAKEKKNFLDSIREIMPALRLQSKSRLCFEHDLELEGCLGYSELYLVGIAIASITGKRFLTSTFSPLLIVMP